MARGGARPGSGAKKGTHRITAKELRESIEGRGCHQPHRIYQVPDRRKRHQDRHAGPLTPFGEPTRQRELGYSPRLVS